MATPLEFLCDIALSFFIRGFILSFALVVVNSHWSPVLSSSLGETFVEFDFIAQMRDWSEGE